MKKYCIFLTVFVLTISLFTGCGCTPQGGSDSGMPTTEPIPTVPATGAPIMPTTEPSEEATGDTGMAPENNGGMNGSSGEGGGMNGSSGESSGMNGSSGESGGNGGSGANGSTGANSGSNGTGGETGPSEQNNTRSRRMR